MSDDFLKCLMGKHFSSTLEAEPRGLGAVGEAVKGYSIRGVQL